MSDRDNPRDKSSAAEALRVAAKAIVQHGHDRTLHTIMDVAEYLTDTADRIDAGGEVMTTDSQPTPEQVVADHSFLDDQYACLCQIDSDVDTMDRREHAAHVLAALRDAGYAVVRPDAWGKWLTPGTAHYEHLHTKCVLAGWAAYRQHAGSEVVRSDAVVQATLNTVRDIFAAVERGES